MDKITMPVQVIKKAAYISRSRLPIPHLFAEEDELFENHLELTTYSLSTHCLKGV